MTWSGSAPALIFRGRTWTWADAEHEVSAMVDTLRARGIGARDPVVVQSWNSPELAWTFFACMRLGALFVPLNARLTPAECKTLRNLIY